MAAAADNDAIDDRVYRAVVEGKSEQELRSLIEEIAEVKREAAVNKAGEREDGGGQEKEKPLMAAYRLRRGDLAGVLLEAGAEASDTSGPSALEMCIVFGLVDTLRVLLQSRHRRPVATLDVNEKLPNDVNDPGGFCTLVHLCICAKPVSHSTPIPQLECLEVLVKGGGADVNAGDDDGGTALHLLARHRGRHPDPAAALKCLLALGADLDARADDPADWTPLYYAVYYNDLQMTRLLLEAGASTATADDDDITPLMMAAMYAGRADRATSRAVLQAVLERSSLETRRAKTEGGASAIDYLGVAHKADNAETFRPFEAWEIKVVADLRRAGTPVQPRFAAALLPSVAAHGNALERERAARRSESRRWRAHDEFVQLAFDARDAYAAEERVARLEARVRELEQEEWRCDEGSVAGRVRARRHGGGRGR